MRIKNTTDLSLEEIREIIRFVKPSGIPHTEYDVRITNTEGYCKGYFMGSAKDTDKSEWKIGMVFPIRSQIVARISRNENDFPIIQNNDIPKRSIKLLFDVYNEKKQQWEEWYHRLPIAISKAYLARKSKDKGKTYRWKERSGGYVSSLILSRREALVHILAHEFRHFWQRHHKGKRGRVWNSRGIYSERDADAYAIRKQREWRKLHEVDIYVEQPDITANGIRDRCAGGRRY